VQYLALSHGTDVISVQSVYGCSGAFPGNELNLESVGRIAMEYCSNIALLETVFLYVVGENDCVQLFDHKISSRLGIRLDRQ